MTATRTGAPEGTGGEQAVMARLPVLDRFLPVWIGAAMAAGLLLGRLVPGLNGALNRVAIHGTSLPIALGLLLMMYPVLAKVRYTEIGKITADRRMMTASLLLNWVIGPALMFALAWLFLPVWIGAAMVAGLLLGRVVPGLNGALNRVAIHGTSLPIALGLLLMMYPVLAKVRYTEIGRITADRRMMAASLALNWVIGPAVMFALAWLLLPDQPAYRTGVILVGLARCIAMVLIWTDLASGDREMATVLVALNAVFQVLLYAVLGFFYLQVLPGWLGLPTTSWQVSIAEIAGTVAVFLGIPLVAGYLTRTIGERARGRDWYENRFLPRLGPVALYGLLFTVVILFALQGKKITSEPLDVARIALPLLAYFVIMWFGGFAVSRWLRLSYPRTVSLAFSAASNDFELAIAVAIGVFGVTSGQALAGVVGPLIEVPVMLALVYVALWARHRFYPAEEATP